VAKGYQLYVDGSYINGRVGYGAVLLKDGEEVQRFSGRVHEDLQSRQVGGELMATMSALTWCGQNSITPVEVLYDYEGIEKWARGLWKANLPLTQRGIRCAAIPGSNGMRLRMNWRGRARINRDAEGRPNDRP
jgi:ribonuclease HI